MIDRHRMNEIIAMLQMNLLNLRMKHRGIADAKVYSIRPLTEEETQAISTAFASKVGKQSLTN